MHAIQSTAEVFIHLVGKEGCKRCQQFGHGHQALVQRLIGGQLVVVHLLAPETFLIQTNIPVRQVFIHKGVDESACTGRIKAVHFLLNALNQ